jgi:23S rRNA (uracil1939-C5)-methyltransferase
MRFNLNDELEISIRSLGSSGEGVGAYDGVVGFVEGALPGETVRVRVTTAKKNYFKADLLKVLDPSPDRVTPICPVFGRCGGCQLMHLSYDKQLQVKTSQVEDALQRIGGFADLKISPCTPSPNPLYYRNKIQLPVAYSQEGLIIGLYARGSHDIIPVEKCYIHCATGEKVFDSAQKILREMAKPSRGELRHLLIRTAIHENAVLLVLVTTGIEKGWLQEVAEKIMSSNPEVKGVVENVNRRTDNVILGTEYKLISGVATIEETLCGLRFRLSPHAFFQVNTPQVENLYRAAIGMCDLAGNETVVDAYCGVGTMALLAASSARAVVGIEYVADAIRDARYNAELNNIKNAQFEVGAAEDLLKTIPKMDVVLLNPPRKGCDEKLLETVLKKLPRIVVYVSCNPATLARDLKTLSSKYQVEEVKPFDMFPQTSHVETVVKLRRL